MNDIQKTDEDIQQTEEYALGIEAWISFVMEIGHVSIDDGIRMKAELREIVKFTDSVRNEPDALKILIVALLFTSK